MLSLVFLFFGRGCCRDKAEKVKQIELERETKAKDLNEDCNYTESQDNDRRSTHEDEKETSVL